MPRLYTIDGSQGSEAKIAILDLVVTDATNTGAGSTKDKKRCNVTFTRGKPALWRFGGPPEGVCTGYKRPNIVAKEARTESRHTVLVRPSSPPRLVREGD